jgi:protein-disulfide isomerase
MSRRLRQWVALALVLLLAVACGPEAPQRTAAPTAASPSDRLRPSGVTVVPALASAAEASPDGATANGDPRSQGDPDAPITVVEFSDFQ